MQFIVWEFSGRRHFQLGVGLPYCLHQQAVVRIAWHKCRAGLAALEHTLTSVKL